ncbi:MAG TPA: DUF3592 domain-containing protein [Nostocaceae cyanobacterium]|nr:DUF3592 domain-containing protein [Nostocaceae cyanobacterium]
MSKSFVIYGSLFALAGSLCTALGIKISIDTHSFLNTAIPTQGTVTDFVRRSSTKNSKTYYTYYPLIKFTTKEGEPTKFESSSGSNPPAYTKGQQIDILYNPQDPQSAMINSWWDIWGFSIITTSLGSVFALSGGGLIIFSLNTFKTKTPKF